VLLYYFAKLGNSEIASLHLNVAFSLPINTTTTTTVLQPFFRDHPGDPVPEENFWTLWCKGRLTEADTSTIWLGATPSGLSSAHLHHPPCFLKAGCPSCLSANSVKALKASEYINILCQKGSLAANSAVVRVKH